MYVDIYVDRDISSPAAPHLALDAASVERFSVRGEYLANYRFICYRCVDIVENRYL